MAADIVNLRQARKRKARLDREREAEANRHLYGRLRSERLRQEATKELETRKLDGSLRPPAGGISPSDTTD